ncbi:MAG: hypothetical protein AMQ22_00086 [Candidatus Methanofastidiosum methylothiophilum]|uniref:Uncharacterized protein n=1 Tax=Candidatus Methanofastidiosum methylothiophilum TaxID=1705564 RepID=A0A150J9L5_9EURY|nr:MAG: hypothetical protein AMQ22_00086 [Candidatus Methanofastidiosum methylthiophilus]
MRSISISNKGRDALMATKYDWDSITNDFIQGLTNEDGEFYYPSHEELSEKYGPAIKTLMNRSSKEKWKEKREIFRTKKNNRIEEKKIEQFSNKAVEFDLLNLDIATKGLELVNDRLDDPSIDNHNITKLSNAALNYEKEGNIALGRSVEKTESEQRIENVGGESDGPIKIILQDPNLRADATEFISKVFSSSD